MNQLARIKELDKLIRKAKWHYVETGKENGKEVEILEGLEANSQVITSNNLQLEHDTPVEGN